jgi:hypothetical protein
LRVTTGIGAGINTAVEPGAMWWCSARAVGLNVQGAGWPAPI